MILPDTDLTGALHVAEAVQVALAKLNIPHEYSLTSGVVSISGGIAALIHDGNISAAPLIKAADRCLYQAKQLGRNRIIAAESELREAMT